MPMRISPELQMPFRLLFLLPFPSGNRRVTASLAVERNRFAAALATNVLVAHAAQGSRTAALVEEVLAAGKRVVTVDNRA